MAIITQDEAIGHLRLDMVQDAGGSPTVVDERLADLLMKIRMAEAIIVDYLKYQDTGWNTSMYVDPGYWDSGYTDDVSGAPEVIRSAVLIMLSALWEDREGTSIGDYLKPEGAIANILRRFRDPAIA